jgi:hypothetical protein
VGRFTKDKPGRRHTTGGLDRAFCTGRKLLLKVESNASGPVACWGNLKSKFQKHRSRFPPDRLRHLREPQPKRAGRIPELWLIAYKPMSSTYRDSAGEVPSVSGDRNFFRRRQNDGQAGLSGDVTGGGRLTKSIRSRAWLYRLRKNSRDCLEAPQALKRGHILNDLEERVNSCPSQIPSKLSFSAASEGMP